MTTCGVLPISVAHFKDKGQKCADMICDTFFSARHFFTKKKSLEPNLFSLQKSQCPCG